MRVAASALILLTLLVYARSLGNGFVEWDDGLLITENPIVHGITPAHLWRAFTTYDPELYIPLTFVSYQMNYAIAGLSSWIYHLTNLLLHIANALLVVWFVRLLSQSSWAAVAMGFLFAIHPLHTEAVAWASARKDVLSTFFLLLTLVSYRIYKERGEGRWYIVSCGAFLLGLLSKVTIILTPFVLLLIDWRRGEGIDRHTIREKIPYFLLSILFGVIAYFGKSAAPMLPLEKLLLGAKATLFYLGKLFVPTGLSVLYPYTQPIALTTPDLLVSLLAVLAICVLTWFLRRRVPDLAFAWAFFLLLLAPTFNNVAKGQDLLRDVYFASDRYAYAASIGILLALALFLGRLRERWHVLSQGVLIVFILGFSFLTFKQSLTWKDTETLFRTVLAQYPNSHVAHSNLGSILYRNGDVEDAIGEYRKSLAIRPNSASYFNLGQIAVQGGRTDDAITLYRNAIETRPGDTDARVNLGVLLLREGRGEEAIRVLEEAARIAPQLAIVHFNLGLAYEKAGRAADAAAVFRRVLELDPSDAEAREKPQR